MANGNSSIINRLWRAKKASLNDSINQGVAEKYQERGACELIITQQMEDYYGGYAFKPIISEKWKRIVLWPKDCPWCIRREIW